MLSSRFAIASHFVLLAGLRGFDLFGGVALLDRISKRLHLSGLGVDSLLELVDIGSQPTELVPEILRNEAGTGREDQRNYDQCATAEACPWRIIGLQFEGWQHSPQS
jgi:hypothetical protein